MVSDPERAIGIDVDHGNIRRVVIEVDGETPESAAPGIVLRSVSEATARVVADSHAMTARL